MKKTVESKLIQLMSEPTYRGLTQDELVTVFAKAKQERAKIKEILLDMEKRKLIASNSKGNYKLTGSTDLKKGIISVNGKGFGFIAQETGEDLFVAPQDINFAMDHDEVLYKIIKEKEGQLKAQARVEKIIKRNTDVIVGRFIKNKNFAFVVSNDQKIDFDVYIPKKFFGGAKNKDIVACKILKYPEKNKKPEGMILEVIGYKRDMASDIKGEIAKAKLSEKFPPKVNKQLDHFKGKISSAERSRRKYFGDMIFTIDGADAKDLDDAISVKKSEDGGYLLGVYIADVSHYVSGNSPLDKEALKRGTSYYFANRVIPMLPELLSNDLCSLNPDEEKLVLALSIRYDKKGNMQSHSIHEGIIRSKYRLVYEDVSDFLEEGKGKLLGINDKELAESLLAAGELSKLLREKRKKRGSIDFDLPETKFVFNKEAVVDVKIAERREANRLIEDFMIAANEVIAESFYNMDIPFMYRIHESPKAEKLEDIYLFLDSLNIKPKSRKDKKIFPADIQKVLKESMDLPQKDIIQYGLLRSMQKAKYSDKNIGHFGLASKCYTHFTSPIRRYPDLQIHRIIKEILHGKMDLHAVEKYEKLLPSVSDEASRSEQKAIEFERKISDIVKCYYMKKHIGELFEGKIVNFTTFGIIILLNNSIEGVIRYSAMDDKKKELFDTEKTGHPTKRYKIGDYIQVEVEDVDMEFKEIILYF